MTCKEKCDELFKTYNKVTMLANKNDSTVMRIRHKVLSKDLVLHVLPKIIPTYSVLCDIRCENLPAVYDTYSCDDGMVVLEEYIDGVTVADIASTRRYMKHGAVKVTKEVCAALTVLHQYNIIHRDVKPENVMVDKNGRVILIDFNASRKISVASHDTEIMGTVGYAAPEQMGLTQSDPRTDIYATGVLLNILLTGKYPSQELAKGRLGRIIEKCTHVQPDKRYQSAMELYRVL